MSTSTKWQKTVLTRGGVEGKGGGGVSGGRVDISAVVVKGGNGVFVDTSYPF